MKLGIRTALSLFALTFATVSPALAEGHVTSTSCEAFVDKVGYSTYDFGYLRFFVKVNTTLLDGRVKRVGLRNKSTTIRLAPEGKYSRDYQDWNEINGEAHKGSDHYFMITVPVGGGRYGYQQETTYEGVFFVETDKGTYYWIKNTSAQGPRTDAMFTFGDGWRDLLSAQLPGFGTNYTDEADMARLPRAYELLPHLNPKQCK